MMSGRLTTVRLAAMALLALAASAGLVARQTQKPPSGARVAVVAFRDSQLLTICPVFSREVIERPPAWMPGDTPVKATVTTSSTGQSVQITVHHPDLLHTAGAVFGSAQLPAPAALAPRPVPPAVPTPPPAGDGTLSSLPVVAAAATLPATELDRLALDLDVKARVEGELRKEQVYAVVERPDEADYVFLIESRYTSMAATTTTSAQVRPAGTPVNTVWLGGDRRPNWRQSSLALVVPAEAYRRYVGDGSALTAARLWEGLAFAELARDNRGPVSRAASPEALADDVSGKWPTRPSSLPLCAASVQTLRMPDDAPARPAASGNEALAPATPVPASAATFRAMTTLVNVPLTITDTSGRQVLDARMSELHVFEDGVEQKTDKMFPVAAPSSVALLLDTSNSMRLKADDVRSAARALVDLLRPDDRLLLASFSNRVGVHAEFTTDRGQLRQAVSQVRTGEATRLFDAITLLIADRLIQVEGRKAIVLLTDGVDTRSQLTDAATTLATVERSNTAVYVVRYDTADATRLSPNVRIDRWLLVPDEAFNNADAHAQADAFLSRLATESGGRMYFAPAGANLGELCGQIAQELAQQYTLSYYSSTDRLDGAYREIRVTIDRPGHTVRARKGYRAPVARR
jgi:VWFA-related protein